MTVELQSPWPEEGETWESREIGSRGGEHYAALHAAERLFLARLAGAALPPDESDELTKLLTEWSERLLAHQVPEIERYDGFRGDLPGRGHALLPPYTVLDETDTTLTATVTFTRFYLGGNGAAHGGTQPLLFDDLLGRIVNHNRAGVARTAYLTVNYRKITPVDVELRAEVSLDREEGRKRWASGRIVDPAGDVVSDCTGLFVQLRPGQP